MTDLWSIGQHFMIGLRPILPLAEVDQASRAAHDNGRFRPTVAIAAFRELLVVCLKGA
jgi:hypothetical protein